MAQIEFFTDVSDDFKTAAKRLNERLNQAIIKEAGLALCEAADKRDVDGFRFILGQYPDQINARNADNDTPFILACNMGSEKLVDLALEHPDVQINAQGNDGMSGFMHACDQNYTDIGKTIYRARSDLDITLKDRDGDTALILAVENKNSELTRIILQRDEANVEEKNSDRESARSIAEAFKGETADENEILELIKTHKSYQVAPPAPEPQTRRASSEVGARRRRAAGAPPAVDTANVPEDIKNPSLRQLAAQYSSPHALALFRWMETNGYEVMAQLTGRIMHGNTKLRMPTLEKFISNPDALYADQERGAYDPKNLSICKQIGYDPSGDYPLGPASTGGLEAKPSPDPA